MWVCMKVDGWMDAAGCRIFKRFVELATVDIFLILSSFFHEQLHLAK